MQVHTFDWACYVHPKTPLQHIIKSAGMQIILYDNSTCYQQAVVILFCAHLLISYHCFLFYFVTINDTRNTTNKHTELRSYKI